jgi:N-acetylmuramoyl-L-alanine amidase
MSKLKQTSAAWLVISLSFLFAAAGSAARSEESAMHTAKDTTKPVACERSAFRVVIDVGHTVELPGAVSARGAPEYSFNLKLADAIKQTLVDAGFDKTVLLITAAAPWPGLVERATRANAMHANLFIAIHHDSVPDQLLETWQYEGQENHFSDRFTGYAIFISNNNAARAGSLAFGHVLGKNLRAAGLHYTPHYTLPLMGRHRHQLLDADAGVYRYDQLLVLRHTLMPAVLLEAGSIVNRQEELELATFERRILTAKAVAAAVANFCDMRAQPSGDRQIKRSPSTQPAAPGRANSTAVAH